MSWLMRMAGYTGIINGKAAVQRAGWERSVFSPHFSLSFPLLLQRTTLTSAPLTFAVHAPQALDAHSPLNRDDRASRGGGVRGPSPLQSHPHPRTLPDIHTPYALYSPSYRLNPHASTPRTPARTPAWIRRRRRRGKGQGKVKTAA